MIVCNGKDPPWFNNKIKLEFKKKMLHIRFIAITKITKIILI